MAIFKPAIIQVKSNNEVILIANGFKVINADTDEDNIFYDPMFLNMMEKRSKATIMPELDLIIFDNGLIRAAINDKDNFKLGNDLYNIENKIEETIL